MNDTELFENLELKKYSDHQWFIKNCNGITGKGLFDGIKWILYSLGLLPLAGELINAEFLKEEEIVKKRGFDQIKEKKILH